MASPHQRYGVGCPGRLLQNMEGYLRGIKKNEKGRRFEEVRGRGRRGCDEETIRNCSRRIYSSTHTWHNCWRTDSESVEIFLASPAIAAITFLWLSTLLRYFLTVIKLQYYEEVGGSAEGRTEKDISV